MKKVSPVKWKKFLIFLPIFLLALAGLIAAILSLFPGHSTGSQRGTPTKNAFNKNLPSPNLPTRPKNKLELYMEATRDSLLQKTQWERDTLNRHFTSAFGPSTGHSASSPADSSIPSTNTSSSADPNEQKVNDRLHKLYSVINQPRPSPVTPSVDKQPGVGAGIIQPTPDIQRLERALKAAHAADTATDPNLERVEHLLDKMLQIQHPDHSSPSSATVRTGTPAASPVFPVSTSRSLSTASDPGDAAAFFGLTTDRDTVSRPHALAISAVIPEDQQLQTGSNIKIRLLEPVTVDGQTIPANTFIYGICTINAERIQIQLSDILLKGQIISVAMKVFDTDGLEGIYIPGALTRDVVKEGAAQGVGSMNVMSLDPSLGAQAAAAGIETAKTLFSHKMRAVVVTVKSGHLILLQNIAASK